MNAFRHGCRNEKKNTELFYMEAMGVKSKLFVCVLLASLFMFLVSCALAGELEVLFFNAGKADACLLKTPESTVLIDTGKNKMGKEIVSYLNKHGIHEIDVMFITHFDKDHVGGADKVLEQVKVLQIIEPDYVSDSKQYIQYKEAVDHFGTPVTTLNQNASFEMDGVVYEIDVANQNYYGEDEENDFSLVIGVKYGNVSFLFAGDAENPRLSELLAEKIGEYDVLKVPHHGREEKMSAAFFDAVKPQYSVITSDEEDLEDVSVVRKLQSYGEVYLTRYGEILCVTDGNSITVKQN